MTGFTVTGANAMFNRHFGTWISKSYQWLFPVVNLSLNVTMKWIQCLSQCWSRPFPLFLLAEWRWSIVPWGMIFATPLTTAAKSILPTTREISVGHLSKSSGQWTPFLRWWNAGSNKIHQRLEIFISLPSVITFEICQEFLLVSRYGPTDCKGGKWPTL